MAGAVFSEDAAFGQSVNLLGVSETPLDLLGLTVGASVGLSVLTTEVRATLRLLVGAE